MNKASEHVYLVFQDVFLCHDLGIVNILPPLLLMLWPVFNINDIPQMMSSSCTLFVDRSVISILHKEEDKN